MINRRNHASKGGAVAISRFALVQLSACQVSSNSATEGGALFTLSAASSSVFGTNFDNNTASNHGGAFSLQATTAVPNVVSCFGCSFRFVSHTLTHHLSLSLTLSLFECVVANSNSLIIYVCVEVIQVLEEEEYTFSSRTCW